MRLFADTTPLQSPDFRRLWVAGIPTVIGANLTIFAVPVQIYALTKSSAYVGLAGLFAPAPLIVFGLLGGAWADAMDRRILLIIASCGLAVSSLLLWAQAVVAVEARTGVWLLLCLLSVQQAFYAVNAPTRAAAILAAALSAGAVAGGVVSGWLPRIHRQGLTIVVAIVVSGAAMVGFGVAVAYADGRPGPVLWVSLAFLAVGGAADMVSAAFRSTILQQVASDEMRGRL